MTGRASHRSIRRLRAAGRTILALGAALVILAVIAPAGLAEHAQASDTRAILHQGNPTAGNTCVEGDLVIGDQENQSPSAAGISGAIGTGDVPTGIPSAYEDVQVLNVTVTNPLIVISGVWVKGGPGANEYTSHLTNLIAPRGHSGELAGISHWFVCYTIRDPIADPAILKTGPASDVTVGSAYSFTLEITNAGEDGSSTGPFTISDTVPALAGTVTGVTDDSDDASCSNAGNVVSCSVTDLAQGDSITVTVNVTAPADGPGVCGPTHTNTASLSTDGDNSSTENDSSSDTVTFAGCTTTSVVVPTPSVDVEKLVSLDGGDSFSDADSAPTESVQLALNDDALEAVFRIIVTNTSGDGTVLDITSLTDEVTAGDADALDLSDCEFPEDGLADGESVTCDVEAGDAQEGALHTNVVSVSATGGDQTVGDNDPANYSIVRVGGVVIERPPPPAPEPEPEPEPAPQPAPETPVVQAEELPRTGVTDLWLAGLALMLLGAGLLMLARGRTMAFASQREVSTWWK